MEIWTKIINYLNHFPLQLQIVQNVCQLFWNIVQDEFVAKGKLKSDLYEIRRPFNTDDKIQDFNTTENDNIFVFINEDKLMLKCYKPCWLLGVGFHGPYNINLTPIKNLKVPMYHFLFEKKIK